MIFELTHALMLNLLLNMMWTVQIVKLLQNTLTAEACRSSGGYRGGKQRRYRGSLAGSSSTNRSDSSSYKFKKKKSNFKLYLS